MPDFNKLPIVVYVFPGDPEPTTQEVLKHVRTDQRFREVKVVRVFDHEDMLRHIYNPYLPFKAFVTKSAPEESKKKVGNVIE